MRDRIIEWLVGHPLLVLFAFITIVQVVRGFFTTRKNQAKPLAKPDELEEQRRVREIQEEIRRRIAERRGDTPGEEPPVMTRESTPAPPPRRPIETTQMPDPFEGPLRRVMQEFEKRVQPQTAAPVPPPPAVERRNYELERQVQLEDDLKAAEEARHVVQRRAAQAVAAKMAATQTEGALRTVARGRLLDDLHDPQTLRRAMILREVLGPPVALR